MMADILMWLFFGLSLFVGLYGILRRGIPRSRRYYYRAEQGDGEHTSGEQVNDFH